MVTRVIAQRSLRPKRNLVHRARAAQRSAAAEGRRAEKLAIFARSEAAVTSALRGRFSKRILHLLLLIVKHGAHHRC
jgi:hypothetical protein